MSIYTFLLQILITALGTNILSFCLFRRTQDFRMQKVKENLCFNTAISYLICIAIGTISVILDNSYSYLSQCYEWSPIYLDSAKLSFMSSSELGKLSSMAGASIRYG